MKQLAYRIPDCAKVLGIGQTSVWKLLKDGDLKSIKIAGRTLVPAAEVQRLLDASIRR